MSTNGQLVFTDVDKITFKGVGNTSNAVVDTVTGKIGVGIDSPDANLHVLGNSYVSTNLELGGTLIMGTVNVSAHHSLEAVTAEGNTTPLTIEFSNATTGIVTTGNVEVGKDLVVSGNVEVGTANLFVDTANSRMGVGTTSPSHALTVAAASGDAEVHIQAQGNDGGDAILYFNGSPTNQRKCAIISSNVAPNSYCKQDLHFCMETTSDLSDVDITDSKMVITNAGNVGVGMTSPGKTLDVNGITRSRKTAGWKSGTFDSTGVNMGPMADGTTDGPQIGWEFHITFSAASPGSRVVVYGAYKHSGPLYAASEKWTWRFREGYSSLDYSNYAELVNDSESAHASYYAVIRVVNCLYTNADVGNARHHFMSHSVGTYAGVGASIWQAQGYIDMGGESIDDRFNYLRITSSNGNIKGQWTAFPITT